VQAIKPQTLLEITGPLFVTYPVVSNVQYWLSEADGRTLLKFRPPALGLIQEDHQTGVSTGWSHIHNCVRMKAETLRSPCASLQLSAATHVSTMHCKPAGMIAQARTPRAG
jgi:hypothetical protein